MRIKVKGILCGLFAIIMTIGGIGVSAAAPINVLGIETNTPWAYDILDFVPGLSFTKVSESAFSSVDLTSFNALLISDNPTQSTIDALNARKSDLATWLGAGHGIFALALTHGTNQYDWVPPAIQPAFVSVGNDTVHIADSSHPVMAGLTDDGLSGWSVSAHGIFENTAGWDVLVREASGLQKPVTVATSFGLGRILLTLQDADEHHSIGVIKPDQVTFVQNGIAWVAGSSSSVDPGSPPIVDASPLPPLVGAPEPASLLLLGSGLAGLVWQLRRNAKRGYCSN